MPDENQDTLNENENENTEEESLDLEVSGEEGDLLIEADLRRDEQLILYVKVSPEIENLFQTSHTSTSENWAGETPHEFYKREYNADLEKHMANRKDYFGEYYVDGDNNINLGILRTVGISEGREFQLGLHYSEETMMESIENLQAEVIKLYKKFIAPVHVRCRTEKVQIV